MDYGKDPDTRKSVSGYTGYLEGAPFIQKSRMQAYVTLSVTEAECVAAVQCVQEMLFAMRVLQSMKLQVQLPMILWMDNSGAIDLFNS